MPTKPDALGKAIAQQRIGAIAANIANLSKWPDKYKNIVYAKHIPGDFARKVDDVIGALSQDVQEVVKKYTLVIKNYENNTGCAYFPDLRLVSSRHIWLTPTDNLDPTIVATYFASSAILSDIIDLRGLVHSTEGFERIPMHGKEEKWAEAVTQWIPQQQANVQHGIEQLKMIEIDGLIPQNVQNAIKSLERHASDIEQIVATHNTLKQMGLAYPHLSPEVQSAYDMVISADMTKAMEEFGGACQRLGIRYPKEAASQLPPKAEEAQDAMIRLDVTEAMAMPHSTNSQRQPLGDMQGHEGES